MKKLWSRLCFLVVAVSCISRGQSQNESTVSPNNTPGMNSDSDTIATSTPPPLPADENDTISSSSQNSTSVNTTDQPTTASTVQGETNRTDDTDVGEGGVSTPVQTTAWLSKKPVASSSVNSVTTVTTSTSPTPVTIEDKSSSSWGYVILVFIILVIIILCVILYLLRRVSRTYSFDLQRPSPASHCNVPTGTFEPVYLDDLDHTAPKDQVTIDDPSPPPVSNGTTLQSEEKGSGGEQALQEQPDANGVETLSLGINSPPADITSDQLESTTIFFDAIGEEQQNENNNNPCETVCIDIHNAMEPSSGLLQ